MTTDTRLLAALDQTISLLAAHNKLREADWLRCRRSEIQRGGVQRLTAVEQVHKITTNMGGLADMVLSSADGRHDFVAREELDFLADEIFSLTAPSDGESLQSR